MTAFDILIAVIAAAIAAATFYGANRATRSKAASDNRAVDAAAYSRATDIYESTITALRDEIGRLTTEIQAARTEIHDVRAALTQIRRTNDRLVAELTHQRATEHDELTVLRDRETSRLDTYDNPPASGPEAPDG